MTDNQTKQNTTQPKRKRGRPRKYENNIIKEQRHLKLEDTLEKRVEDFEKRNNPFTIFFN